MRRDDLSSSASSDSRADERDEAPLLRLQPTTVRVDGADIGVTLMLSTRSTRRRLYQTMDAALGEPCYIASNAAGVYCLCRKHHDTACRGVQAVRAYEASHTVPTLPPAPATLPALEPAR